MNLVIPLAGKDERFEKRNIFKPFIEIEGKPLIKFCTDSIPYIFERQNINIFFIILKEHEQKYSVKSKLKELYSNSTILELDKPTEGAACTVLEARKYIDNDDELVVYLADIYVKSDLKKYIEGNLEVDGFIPTFKSDNKKYSYSVVNGKYVERVAEKVVISDNASSGFYYFRKGRIFVEAALNMIKDDSKRAGLGEKKWFFICPVYNDVIPLGYKVMIIPSEFIFDLGDDKFIEKYIGS